MNRFAGIFCLSFLVSPATTLAFTPDIKQCAASDQSTASLIEMKEAKFAVEPGAMDAMLNRLQHCLASPDPQLRDGVAYEALTYWLRNDKLTQSQKLGLFTQLLGALNTGKNDPDGVYLPFVTLVFAEAVRSDRISPYLSSDQRQQAVSALNTYMAGITDYRGFDQVVGWRHGVAHGADVVLQLALNPQISQAQLQDMANTVASQVRPTSPHFYIYGEPDRMARAIGYTMLREEVPIEFWQNWLAQVSDPAPFASWAEVFSDQQGLVQRHNLRQFLTALYALIGESKNQRLGSIKESVVEQITSIN